MARCKTGVVGTKHNRRKTKNQETLDYHEGLSASQAKIICRELGLDYYRLVKWLDGQTCPIIPRTDEKTGDLKQVVGIYEYDIFRWIDNQKKDTPLVWD